MTVDGQAIELAPKEFGILEYLLARAACVALLGLAAVVLAHWYLVTPKISERPLIVTTQLLMLVLPEEPVTVYSSPGDLGISGQSGHGRRIDLDSGATTPIAWQEDPNTGDILLIEPRACSVPTLLIVDE